MNVSSIHYTKKIVSQDSSETAELVRSGNEKSALFKGVTYKPKDLSEICKNKDLQKETLLFSLIVCHLCLDPYYNYIPNAKSFEESPISSDLVVKVDKSRAALLIKEPTLVDETLEFYVAQTGTGMPYQVRLNLNNPKIEIEDII